MKKGCFQIESEFESLQSKSNDIILFKSRTKNNDSNSLRNIQNYVINETRWVGYAK